MNTSDIKNIFIEKLKSEDFRYIGNDVQQSKTIEIQNAIFDVDKLWILREPNIEYIQKELEWYKSQSLNVDDIEGDTPKMWKACATPLGYINSNYGWCIWSQDNFNQFKNCLNSLIRDKHTREAVMIYNRPSMQYDYCKDGMHDFMCCQYVHYFINEREDKEYIDSIVNFRSCDAVFGFNNDSYWMNYVLRELTKLYNKETKSEVLPGKITWNCGSLHVYERHFKFVR